MGIMQVREADIIDGWLRQLQCHLLRQQWLSGGKDTRDMRRQQVSVDVVIGGEKQEVDVRAGGLLLLLLPWRRQPSANT